MSSKRRKTDSAEIESASSLECEEDDDAMTAMRAVAHRFVAEQPERYEAAKQKALAALGIVMSVMTIMAALAAPRFLATKLRKPPTREQILSLLDDYLAFLDKEAGAENQLAHTKEPTRRIRTLLEIWDFGPMAPAPIIEAAREYMKAYGFSEPDEGWDQWEGPEESNPEPR